MLNYKSSIELNQKPKKKIKKKTKKTRMKKTTVTVNSQFTGNHISQPDTTMIIEYYYKR